MWIQSKEYQTFGSSVSVLNLCISHITGAVPSQLGDVYNNDRSWLFLKNEVCLSDTKISGSDTQNWEVHWMSEKHMFQISCD